MAHWREVQASDWQIFGLKAGSLAPIVDGKTMEWILFGMIWPSGVVTRTPGRPLMREWGLLRLMSRPKLECWFSMPRGMD